MILTSSVRNRKFQINTTSLQCARRPQGFTLVEVLVAMIVLAIGLLGLAGLQTAGLSANQGAFHRSQATHAISDMIDRMRANPDGVDAGAYDDIHVGEGGAGVPSIQTCISTDAGCSPDKLALHDIRQWARLFSDVYDLGDGYRPNLPGGSGEVSRTAGDNFIITVSWQELDWGADSKRELTEKSLSMQVTL